MRTRSIRICAATLLAGAAATAQPVLADAPPPAPLSTTPPLELQFRDPPASARPRVWWHWMNGNITQEGIARDLDWMHRMGIGGAQTFDVNLATPQIVPHRLAYMTPSWQAAFRFAASESDRLGLELGIASSPGWSETGGPWVAPQDGLKKLVWTETLIDAGQPFTGKLAKPAAVTGPFQTLPQTPSIDQQISGQKPPPPPTYYADVAVLAVPQAASGRLQAAAAHDGTGSHLDAGVLSGADLTATDAIAKGATTGQLPLLALDYPRSQAVRSATIFIPGGASAFTGAVFLPELQASEDGTNWRTIRAVPLADIPTTVSFPVVLARHFRLVIAPAPAHGPAMTPPVPGLVIGDPFAGAAGAARAQPLQIAEFRLSPDARVDRYETKAGFATTLDYYALGDPGDAASGPAPGNVVDITAHMQTDGTLDWTPPVLPHGGKWRIIRLGASLLGTTNHPAAPEATGLEVDKFDGEVVRRYMDHYLGLYRDAAGPDLIGRHGVRALVTDSIEVGAANWTPRMIEQFKRLRGYDPTPWLPTLAGVLIGSRADSDRFLYDYRRTLADLMASEHYGTVAKIAHQAGLTVYGEALEDKRPSLGDDMAMRRYTDVPMAAMWSYPRDGAPNPTYLADIKGAASVAHIYGQNLVAAESMTAAMAPWAFGPSDLKRIIDLEFVTGVNRPVVHTSVHVPVEDKLPGLSLFIIGQYFNRNESWAELARPWVDYIARNGFLLQQGHDVADVAYFYGEEAPLTGLYGLHPVADAPRTSAFDFVNADALLTAISNDGHDLVTPGGARYRVLYLGGSSRRMTLAVLRRIAELVTGGATVVGLKPEGSPSLSGADRAGTAEYAALVGALWPGGADVAVGKGRVIASDSIEPALRQLGIAPDFAFTGAADANIPFVHRRLAAETGGGDSYFLVNRKNRPEAITAHFRVTGRAPELWHAETGLSDPVSYRIADGETIVPLTLGAEESVHVVFRKPAATAALTVSNPAPAVVGHLDGAWKVSFQPNRGAPAAVVLPALAPLNDSYDTGIKYFSGIATYSHGFASPRHWRPGQALWLDLGDVHELARVTVNGVLVGTVWHAPFRLPIGSYTHQGRNHLAIEVADLWVNRLIGDAQPGVRQKITWTAMPTYRSDAPLRPSGLIGPVTLLGTKP